MSEDLESGNLKRVELSPLTERLHEVFSGKSFRAVGDLTGASHETVRRYLQGQTPSVEFLEAVCRNAGINGQWLLTGRGPKRVEHIRSAALNEANASELLAAMARALEKLTERVDRLEVFVQTVETRLRAATAPMPTTVQGSSHEPFASKPVDRAKPIRGAGQSSGESSGPAAGFARGGDAVADALPKRPSPDAG